jgi:hypothetical protein
MLTDSGSCHAGHPHPRFATAPAGPVSCGSVTHLPTCAKRCMGGSGACLRCTNARRECTYGELDSMEDRVFRDDISGMLRCALTPFVWTAGSTLLFCSRRCHRCVASPHPGAHHARLTIRSVNPLTASRSTPCNIRGRHSEHCLLRPSLTVWTTSSTTTSPQRDQVCLLRCAGNSSRSPH